MSEPPTQPPATVGSDIDYTRFLDCVHCGLCTSACPTYLETGNENDSPRGRIYLMRAVTDGRLPLSDSVQRHLDLCLDCRSCETACPSGVQYGRLIEPFRVAMSQADDIEVADNTPGWFRDWILYRLFPFPNRLRWSLAPVRLLQLTGIDRLLQNLGAFRLLPKPLQRMHNLLPKLSPRGDSLPEVLPAKGTKRARVALFTGCVADAMFHSTHWATARVLQENGCEVVIPRQQVCCGAIHYHSGSATPAMEFAEQNVSTFAAADVDAVIINVAGCGSMLKDYGHIAQELDPNDRPRAERFETFADKVKDICEFLVELGPIAPQGSISVKATYHDACHLAHAQQVRDAPRQLLELVPGLEIAPLAESDICCGAAGSYNLTEPEMADRLAQRKADNILATKSQGVITGNAGCHLQIQSTLRAGGHGMWVAHPMDILDASYRGVVPEFITSKTVN